MNLWDVSLPFYLKEEFRKIQDWLGWGMADERNRGTEVFSRFPYPLAFAVMLYACLLFCTCVSFPVVLHPFQTVFGPLYLPFIGLLNDAFVAWGDTHGD